MLRSRIPLPALALVAILGPLGGCTQMIGPGQVGPIGVSAVWFQIRFPSDSALVGEDGQKVITNIITYLQGNPGSVATLIGRTDTVGSADYNARLSHLRADAVRDALVYAAAIPADRVEVRWTGERNLALATYNEVGAASNRVVDVAIH